MDAIWTELYQAAKAVLNPRQISEYVSCGEVAAAILSGSGRIYTGVCLDTACTLGVCAERSAMAAMLTHGESRIARVVAVMPDGRVGSPCGACREFMMQLDAAAGGIEILLDLKTEKTVRLKELVPDWWGCERFEEQ